MIYQDNTWIQDFIDRILDKIFENTHVGGDYNPLPTYSKENSLEFSFEHIFLSDNYPIYKNKLCNRIQRGIEEWLEMAIDDEKYSKESRKEIKLILFNMRNKIKGE